MPKKSLKVAAFLASVGLILLLFGTSYAWLESSIFLDNDIYMKSEDLDIYLDNVKGGIVKLEDVNPITDLKGKNQEGYSFTIANNGNDKNDYIIFLDNVDIENENNRQFDKNIKYQLSNYKITKTSRLSKTGEVPYRILDTGSIEPGESITYKLRVWLDSETNKEDISRDFLTKIRVKATKSIENLEKLNIFSIGEKSSSKYNQLVINKLIEDNTLENYKVYEEDLPIDQLLNNINKNIQIETSTGKENIQKLIKNSNVIMLSIGMMDSKKNSLFNKNFYDNGNTNQLVNIVDNIAQKLDNLISRIRLINKDATIILMGQYNLMLNDSTYQNYISTFDIVYNHYNDKYYEICQNFNCYFVEEYNLFKNSSIYTTKDGNLTNDGYNMISDAIIEIIYS